MIAMPSPIARRRLGLLAVVLALGLGFLASLVRTGEEGPAATILPPGILPVGSALAAPLPPPSAQDWETVDKAIAGIVAVARQQALSLAQKKVNGLVNVLNERVATAFVPWYASFGRRKLEELRAYNFYALDWLHRLRTGEVRDTGTPALTATFEEQFAEQVLRPEDTRRTLMTIGKETAQEFGGRVAHGLQLLQEERGISFAQWNRHLANMPPLTFTGPDGHPVKLSIVALTAPDPAWHDLGATVGKALVARFDRHPPIADRSRLVTAKGESIFAVGQHAGLYFGSYVVYWVFLLILIRMGVIPVSLFGALLGWVAWEIFAWGSWIGLESLDFEQTRAELEVVILGHADAFFAQFRGQLADLTLSGPFKALWQLSP
jgi:hypothetical protein